MREITLTQGYKTIVDDDDYERLSRFKWHVCKCRNIYYAVTKNNVHMHRCILRVPSGMETDHINGNGLDNRKENLRVVSHRVNLQNQHVHKTSKYVGVSWFNQSKKWRADIFVDGKTKYLGLFLLEEDAKKAYDLALQNLTQPSQI